MTTAQIKLTEVRSAMPPGGLSALDRVELCPRYRAMLEAALSASAGPAAWRLRKRAEAADLLALAQVSGRALVSGLDLRESLRAELVLDVPVPCWDQRQENIRVAHGAVLHLTYPHEAIRMPLPGYAFVEIAAPQGVCHANVAAPPFPPLLCLGARLPLGIPLREIVLLAYGALAMQTVMIDPKDSAGVLNPKAAAVWQDRRDLMPLSREPFIRPATASTGGTAA